MNLNDLKQQLTGQSAEESLRTISSVFRGKVVFTTSFSIEDQVITYFISQNNNPVEIVTLDTGRLFNETYKVFNETIKKFNLKIRSYFPESDEIEKMVSEKGPFSFYYSKENRLECCHKRKVMPLNRALSGFDCWISGIRSDQSKQRRNMERLEYDEERKLFKFYPLFNWSFDETRSFILKNNIPYNVLYDRGFVSIGCEPCTRAVMDDEDFRAGRWWWENGSDKECGLHLK
jgi:phosphoadenosine phosphosulfate reductase